MCVIAVRMVCFPSPREPLTEVPRQPMGPINNPTMFRKGAAQLKNRPFVLK